MKRNIITYIKKYPYLFLIIASGICVYMFCTINYLQSSNEHKMANSHSINEQQQDKDSPVGVTDFEYYEAKETSSPYYTDPGKRALTTKYPYETVDDSYFSDAAFIGDSRTLGLSDYAGVANMDFYCGTGYCTYKWINGEEITYQNTDQDVILDEAMSQKQYKKIYLMLGLNDCGYGNVDSFKNRYQQMITMLHEKQPDAIIFLLANLHMSQEKSDADPVFNNDDINAHNVAIAEFADGVMYFYLDSNEMFVDNQGYLKPELTFDGAHLYADGYQKWMDYYRQHAVIR